jgi:hypothetical protein
MRIGTGYGLDDGGVAVRVPVGSRIVIQTGSGAHPASSYPMGTGDLSPGVEPLGREADHSPPTSAKVKQTWVYTSTPPYAFMA